MTGSLHTDELLSEVVKRDTGIRTGRRISHVFVMDVPGHPHTLFITDAAVNIAPDLAQVSCRRKGYCREPRPHDVDAIMKIYGGRAFKIVELAGTQHLETASNHSAPSGSDAGMSQASTAAELNTVVFDKTGTVSGAPQLLGGFDPKRT